MRPLFSTLAERVLKDGRVALVTIVATEGSTPREVGARMIVTPKGEIAGTIGGGTLEYRLIAEAVSALQNSRWQADFRDVPLGPELGQCCGGRLTYIIEAFHVKDHEMLEELANREMQTAFLCEARHTGESHLERHGLSNVTQAEAILYDDGVMRELFHDARLPMLLFGAGHVGRALTLALAPLPFRIRWIDSREDAFPQFMPQNVTAIYSADVEAEILAAPAHAFLLVMTHSHALDLMIVSAALRRDDLPFVGLIGSATKRARFMRRLSDAGLGDAARKRLVSPIGLAAISGKEPAVIAASIAADLLIRRDARIASMQEVDHGIPSRHKIEFEDHPHE